MNPQPASTTTVGTIVLVASREIRLRMRSRAYWLITLLTALALAGFAITLGILNSGGAQATIALTQEQASQLRTSLETAAASQDVELTINTVPDVAAGAAAVAAGSADAAIAPSDGTGLHVVVDKDLKPELATILDRVAVQQAVAGEVQRLGGDPAAVPSVLASGQITVEPLTPPRSYDPQRLVIGFIAGVLIYLALMFAGQIVAQGVVEEKTSRVVELLLAAVRPWQLMTGKVLGLGLIGLMQVLIIGVSGLVAGLAAGALDLPGAEAAGILGWLIVWFLLGYSLFSFIFASLGALVSRQEDIGGVVAPVTMILVAGYVIGVSVLPSDPSNTFVAVLSMLPVFSPTLMPIRLAIGGVPIWQALLALGLILVTIPLMIGVTARIYRNAVVRSGARVRLKDALRGA